MPIEQKTAKNGYLYAAFCQKNYFSQSKSHKLIEAHDHKSSLAQKKISSHGNFTLSLLDQITVWTNSTSGKKKP